MLYLGLMASYNRDIGISESESKRHGSIDSKGPPTRMPATKGHTTSFKANRSYMLPVSGNVNVYHECNNFLNDRAEISGPTYNTPLET